MPLRLGSAKEKKKEPPRSNTAHAKFKQNSILKKKRPRQGALDHKKCLPDGRHRRGGGNEKGPEKKGCENTERREGGKRLEIPMAMKKVGKN